MTIALSVATAERRRTIGASPQALWEIICDPRRQPRWWPGVERMESVAQDRFTQVLSSRRGRPVRVDFMIGERDPQRMSVWRQELAGTPFARVLAESTVQIELAPAGAGTAVTVRHRQKLRGYSWTGGFMLRRATGRRLDEALDGLARLSNAPASP
jgi:uncharacterized protein YndB with AHSA1/START domain